MVGVENQFLVFLRVAVLHKFYCKHLYLFLLTLLLLCNLEKFIYVDKFDDSLYCKQYELNPEQSDQGSFNLFDF